MKFGLHAGLWIARSTDDLAPILRTVAELGYVGVEISLPGMTVSFRLRRVSKQSGGLFVRRTPVAAAAIWPTA